MAEAEKLFAQRSDLTVMFDRVLDVACLIHQICIFVWIVRMNRKEPEDVGRKNRTRITFIMTATLFFFVMHAAWVIPMKYGWMCNSTAITVSTWYYCVKFGWWQWNLARLEVVFSNNLLGYPKELFITLKVILVVVLIGALSLRSTNMVWWIPYDKEHDVCGIIPNTPVLMSSVLVDIIINLGCCYLFFRKMRLLLRMGEDKAIVYAMRKGFILNLTAIISYFVLLVMLAISDLLVLAALDAILNCWCLILFDVRLDPIYRRVFSCVAKVPEDENAQMIATATGNNNSSNNSANTGDVEIQYAAESTTTRTETQTQTATEATTTVQATERSTVASMDTITETEKTQTQTQTQEV